MKHINWKIWLLWAALMQIWVLTGFFFAYSHNIVFALEELGYRDFTSFMSLLNKNVRNPYFAFLFFGTHIMSLFLIIFFWFLKKPLEKYHLFFILWALIELIWILFITVHFNLPINAQVEALNPDTFTTGWEMLRSEWRRYNILRTLSGTTTFFLYIIGFYFFIRFSYENK